MLYEATEGQGSEMILFLFWLLCEEWILLGRVEAGSYCDQLGIYCTRGGGGGGRNR